MGWIISINPNQGWIYSLKPYKRLNIALWRRLNHWPYWDMWAVRVQIIGLPALLLFGTRFFFIQCFQGNTLPYPTFVPRLENRTFSTRLLSYWCSSKRMYIVQLLFFYVFICLLVSFAQLQTGRWSVSQRVRVRIWCVRGTWHTLHRLFAWLSQHLSCLHGWGALGC